MLNINKGKKFISIEGSEFKELESLSDLNNNPGDLSLSEDVNQVKLEDDIRKFYQQKLADKKFNEEILLENPKDQRDILMEEVEGKIYKDNSNSMRVFDERIDSLKEMFFYSLLSEFYLESLVLDAEYKNEHSSDLLNEAYEAFVEVFKKESYINNNYSPFIKRMIKSCKDTATNIVINEAEIEISPEDAIKEAYNNLKLEFLVEMEIPINSVQNTMIGTVLTEKSINKKIQELKDLENDRVKSFNEIAGSDEKVPVNDLYEYKLQEFYKTPTSFQNTLRYLSENATDSSFQDQEVLFTRTLKLHTFVECLHTVKLIDNNIENFYNTAKIVKFS
jgi:hypothetical protein